VTDDVAAAAGACDADNHRREGKTATGETRTGWSPAPDAPASSRVSSYATPHCRLARGSAAKTCDRQTDRHSATTD